MNVNCHRQIAVKKNLNSAKNDSNLRVRSELKTSLLQPKLPVIVSDCLLPVLVTGERFTVWNVFKYGVFSGRYFPVFSPNAGKYGPEKTLYLDTFHAMTGFWMHFWKILITYFLWYTFCKTTLFQGISKAWN